tara:strand:+ start:945 stop:1289 length:345 start_codon:yes stop_codon:yes gene_type:complete
MDDVMDVRLNGYLGVVQNKINAYWEHYGFRHADPPLAAVIFKQKYAKVIYCDDGGRGQSQSVHSFVDLSNGDIIKGNWKSPIRTKKGLAVRGNIFADDFGADCITNHGPKYLRR